MPERTRKIILCFVSDVIELVPPLKNEARLKGIDPDTYRGLGARINSDELGRMLEVFFVLTEKATEKKISPKLANAAIQSFEAKKATNNAAKSLSKI